MTTEIQVQRARLILRELSFRSPGIRSCGVVTNDGLMLAAQLSPGVNEDRFAAMCASLLALSARAAKEVERGELRQVILDGEHGPMLLTRGGRFGVLAVAADPSAKLGKLILDTREAAKALAELALS